MTVEVHIQFWLPAKITNAGYDWITVGVLKNPKTFDMNYLKGAVVKAAKEAEYTPMSNTARLVFKQENKTYMKTTFMDLW